METVRATRDLGIRRSATGPHLFECDDGRTYIVKFAGTTKAAVNEFLGHSLSSAIGLPVTRAALVEVSSEMVAQSRDLAQRRVPPGVHQGSEFLRESLDLDQFAGEAQRGARLADPEVLGWTICSDNWMLVPDRNRGDNHLVERVAGRFVYVMVDFSHGFTGLTWTADSIEQGSFAREMMPAHPFVAAAVRGLDSFQPALGRMESLGDVEVERLVASVPASWGVTEEEAGCLLDFLELRRGLVRSILLSHRDLFPNWVA